VTFGVRRSGVCSSVAGVAASAAAMTSTVAISAKMNASGTPLGPVGQRQRAARDRSGLFCHPEWRLP